MLLAAVSVLAAAFLFWKLETRANAAATDARALDTRFATAIRQTFDLRSAQQGYVSQGQNEKFWMQKVAAATQALHESLTVIQGASTAGSSRVAVDGAVESLEEFGRMDRRAREYVAANQKLLASDLIFSDGLEATEEIITALEQVRYVESADRAAARAAARRQQLIFTGAAGAIALLVAGPPGAGPPGRGGRRGRSCCVSGTHPR